MMTALAKECALHVIGEDVVRQFDEQGYVLFVARNGYSYYVFPPIPSRQIGLHRAPLEVMSWCVFGVDPRSDEDPGFRYPREHFFAYNSESAPVYEELASIWCALKDDPRPFLVSGCDPLEQSGTWKRPAISRMLRKIGRKLGPDDYHQAWMNSAFRNASSS